MNWWVLRRQVHVSWLIAAFCWGVVVGVIYSQNFSLPGIWFGVGIALLVLGLWRRKVYAVTFLIIAGLLVGLVRGSSAVSRLSVYDSLVGHSVTVQGFVVEDPDRDKQGNLTLKISQLQVNGHTLDGVIWVSSKASQIIKRSDTIVIKGELGPGFGNVSAGMYRATIVKVTRPVPGDMAGRARDWFADNVRAVVPEPESSLGIGYVVGQRSALPMDLDLALKTVGLTHIVVASGYNLTILVRLARRLFEKVSKYLSALVAGSMIIAFIAVTGASPSMSRAGLVAGLSLLAWYYGRKFHPLVLLPLAAATTLLVHPSYGWNDLGWELSFAAFAGVMIVSPLMQRYFFGDKKPGTVRQIVGETIGAELVTLPLLVLAFGQFSNVGLIANILVLPFVPLAMLLTFIAGIASIVMPAAAGLVGLPASWVLQYMVNVAQYLANVPWVQTKLTINAGVVLVYYLVLVILCFYVWRKTRFNLRDANIVE